MGGKVKGTPRAMAPVEEVDVATAQYEPLVLRAPRLTGFPLRAFVWLNESPLLGPLVTSVLKKQENMTQVPPSLVSFCFVSDYFASGALTTVLVLLGDERADDAAHGDP